MNESKVKPISSRLCDLLCDHPYLTYDDTCVALNITDDQLHNAIRNYNYSNRFNGSPSISKYHLNDEVIVCFEHKMPDGAIPIPRGGKNS